jgi:hypothetical protein
MRAMTQRRETQSVVGFSCDWYPLFNGIGAYLPSYRFVRMSNYPSAVIGFRPFGGVA